MLPAAASQKERSEQVPFVFVIDLSLCMQLKRIPGARLWFLAAMLLLVLFVIYTAVFSTGALLYPNLQLEQVLLHRPLTGIDCVLFEWRQFARLCTFLGKGDQASAVVR